MVISRNNIVAQFQVECIYFYRDLKHNKAFKNQLIKKLYLVFSGPTMQAKNC